MAATRHRFIAKKINNLALSILLLLHILRSIMCQINHFSRIESNFIALLSGKKIQNGTCVHHGFVLLHHSFAGKLACLSLCLTEMKKHTLGKTLAAMKSDHNRVT